MDQRSENYYLAIFNERSWSEFLDLQEKVYGTTEKKFNRAQKIHKGDYFICYVSRLKQIVGLLKINSEAYLDYTKVWDDGIFPVRFKVQVIVAQSIERGITITQFMNDIELFKHLTKKNKWSGFFLNSFNKFPQEDALFIINELVKD